MVSFAKEQVITPQRLAKRLGVSVDTIRRYMRQGLESRKVMGKRFTSLEAMDRFAERFSGGSGQRERSAEVTESLDALRRMGVNVGGKDGGAKRASA